MRRIKTGIEGFDNLVEGGLPENSVILLVGPPGTGKTIFGLQFLNNGIKLGEPGLYLSFEGDNREKLVEQARQFGIDINTQSKNNLWFTLSYPLFTKKEPEITKDILKMIKEHKIKRIVIDSIVDVSEDATFAKLGYDPEFKNMKIETSFLIRLYLGSLLSQLKQLQATSLVISASGDNPSTISKDGISEYLCDGIIKLEYESLGDYSKSLRIRKMRRTNINDNLHRLEIVPKKGIVISSIA